ncbi:helix-turn-helix transcriptional regulator [Promicromonospora sp. NPDC019610]|uniref:helix-turn-helix transcriptional regulator n=1 Tax=Promicromonospora sp. NPDC019610 TaxID=3364405 RepID=UPI00379D0527
MAASDQQRELGQFLRSRRERRRPRDVGLPEAGRRRTPGLRREEVALLAGLSVTWYTWLEQGRNVHGSRQVLGSLVDVLGLDDAEAAHLFRLAGELPERSAAPSADAADADAGGYRALLDGLDPSPALLVDHRFDVAAWNRGAEVLYPGLREVDPSRRNVLWLTFTDERVRAMAEDWSAEAAQSVAFFRARVGQAVTDPDLARLVADLENESEEFRELWRAKGISALGSHTRTVRHPELGRIELRLTKMRTLDDELTLVAYLPAQGSDVADRIAALVDDA